MTLEKKTFLYLAARIEEKNIFLFFIYSFMLQIKIYFNFV